MVNTNTFGEKLFPIHIHSFPLRIMGKESEKQDSPTKTNTNPYTTFTINTYQYIHYDCVKTITKYTTWFGIEQQNKQKHQNRLQHQNKDDSGIKHTNTFIIKRYYVIIKEI